MPLDCSKWVYQLDALHGASHFLHRRTHCGDMVPKKHCLQFSTFLGSFKKVHSQAVDKMDKRRHRERRTRHPSSLACSSDASHRRRHMYICTYNYTNTNTYSLAHLRYTCACLCRCVCVCVCTLLVGCWYVALCCFCMCACVCALLVRVDCAPLRCAVALAWCGEETCGDRGGVFCRGEERGVWMVC